MLPPLIKILILGSGGRDNALAWAMQKCIGVEEVWVAPGNGGTEIHKGCKRLNIEAENHELLIQNSLSLKIDLIIIGPEAPLAEGLADNLRSEGLTVFGPGEEGAKLESSKGSIIFTGLIFANRSSSDLNLKSPVSGLLSLGILSYFGSPMAA